MAVTITEVTSRRDRRAFVGLPYRLYPPDSNWVPPGMRSDQHHFLRRKNPFFEESSGAFLLARHGAEVVGRVAVFEAPAFNRHHGRRWALFHWLEAVDDPSVTRALLDAAAAWARDRRLEHLVGPMAPLPIEPVGLQIEGFGAPPMIGVPRHHPYYEAHLAGAGLEPMADFLTGRIPVDPSRAPEQFLALADAAAEAHGYRVRNFGSRRELLRWVPRIVDSMQEAHGGLWEYRPVAPGEAIRLLRRAMLIADPRVVLVLLQGDRLAGHVFMLPDVAETLRASRGRLRPLWWWRLLRASRTTDRLRMTSIGLAPEHRGTGANLVLYARMMRRASSHRFTEATLGQVNAANDRMIRNLEAVGVPWSVRHRVYGLEL